VINEIRCPGYFNNNQGALRKALERTLFHARFAHVLGSSKDLPPEKVQVVTLGIDPFRVKNRELPAARGREILRRCGIDPARPLITQVSRFGIWKNPWQVMDIYCRVKQQMPSVQLALVGAMEAKDDVKAMEILADLQHNYVHADPDIHLLSDPTSINHEAVNAFQRYSSVILQRSIREVLALRSPRRCGKSSRLSVPASLVYKCSSYQILMITRHCHAERSEASLCPSRQTLRYAQGDTRVSDTTGLRGQLAITQRYSNQSDLISPMA